MDTTPNKPACHLAVEGISKKFPGVIALDKVSMEFIPGKINAIVGENGAGKSTLLKILSGVYTADEGKILLNGQAVRFSNTREAQRNGIAIIHQELKLIPYLSITENIFLGRELLTPLGLLDCETMQARTAEILEKLHLHISPKTLVTHLRVGQQQLVEIAKALLQDARILFLDEPTSAISDKEIERLFEIMADLRAQGVTVVYISHKLDELFQIADGLIALKDGKMMGSRPMGGTTKEDIIRLMVGREVEPFNSNRSTPPSEVILQLKHWSMYHPTRPHDFAIQDLNLSLRRGEILGIFGLMGAGRTELLESIFGLHPEKTRGELHIDNRQISFATPSEAIECGLAFVTEDRKRQGLVLPMMIKQNISMASLEKCLRFGLLDDRIETQQAIDYIEKLKIKTPSENQIALNLSGGNQQKVVLAKWLVRNPQILLLDEPTRGIDINAKSELYHLICQLAADGMGIMLVSSELPEILALADRIIVLAESKLTGEFTREEATEEKLMNKAIAV